jgi:hypothetical protein
MHASATPSGGSPLPWLCVLQLCTLSAAGGDLLNAFPAGAGPLFDVVVVDEAAQALEPATLIPLQLIKPGAGTAGQGRVAKGCNRQRLCAAVGETVWPSCLGCMSTEVVCGCN